MKSTREQKEQQKQVDMRQDTDLNYVRLKGERDLSLFLKPACEGVVTIEFGNLSH